MKKKNYLKPTMMVVPVKYKAPLLVGSNGAKSPNEEIEDYTVHEQQTW